MKVAQQKDFENLVNTLTLVFSVDPFARWLLPESSAFMTRYPDFIRRFGGDAFDHGSAFHTDDYCGVALWSPPGYVADEEKLIAYFTENVEVGKIDALVSIGQQIEHLLPDVPHWHLTFLGVDPISQGAGIGSALLSQTLDECCDDGAPAYLENTNPANTSLYERNGFKVSGQVQAGDSPPLWTMVRQA